MHTKRYRLPLRKTLSLFITTRPIRSTLVRWQRARNLITPPLTTPQHNIMTTNFRIRLASPPLSTTPLLSRLLNHKTTRTSTTITQILLLHLECMPRHHTIQALTCRLAAPIYEFHIPTCTYPHRAIGQLGDLVPSCSQQSPSEDLFSYPCQLNVELLNNATDLLRVNCTMYNGSFLVL